jgi:hypothetical protein
MQQPKISRHARQRLQQRGTRTKEIVLVIDSGDIEIPARSGCRFLRLSHRAVASLLRQDHFPVQDVDRARRLMVLVDPSDRVVTVFKCDPERRFQGVQRGWRRR